MKGCLYTRLLSYHFRGFSKWREKKVTVAKVDTGVSSTNQKVGGSPYCSQHIHLTVYDI